MNNKIEKRLALYNIAVFASVLIAFSAILYFVVRDGFYADLRSHLKQMTDGVVSSIDFGHERHAPLPDLIVSELPSSVSRSLLDMRLQWFDPTGTLTIEKGSLQLNMPLEKKGGYQLQENPRAMIYTRSVVVKDELLGYARVGQPLSDLDRSMEHIELGLILGVLCSSIISGVGISILISKSMQPLYDNIALLKQFTSDASHELRTPVAAIYANSKVALKYPDGMRESDREKFEMIQNATQQMGRLVNDLLQLEQSDLPETPKGGHSREVALVLDDVRKLFSWMEIEKEIDVTIDAEPALFVKMDEDDLIKVVRNLLENALRYTPNRGTISLAAFGEKSDVVIKVRDTGIGISPSDQSKVFDRFWRADKVRSRIAGGNGLGLSIVKSIVTQCGGTIEVESKVDIGSIFTVRLPSARS